MTDAYDVTLDRAPRRVVVKLYRDGDGTAPLETQSGTNTDVAHLGPAMATQIDYVEDNPGRWLYHCHVVDHIANGMIGWYEVAG